MTKREMWQAVKELRAKPAPDTHARVAAVKDEFERAVANYIVGNPTVTLPEIGRLFGIAKTQVGAIVTKFNVHRHRGAGSPAFGIRGTK